MNDAKRIHNLEVAVIALISLIEDDFSPETREAVERMTQDFFGSSKTLGAFSTTEFEGS